MTRWIRARITVKTNGTEIFFDDVGAEELRSIKKKYRNVRIADKGDWGRYLHPRNEIDEAEKKEIMKILGVKQ